MKIKFKNWLDDEKNIIGVVSENGLFLKDVAAELQTDAICLAAVRQNGLALRYAYCQSEKIFLEAMRENGLALAYVSIESQTATICLEAIRQNALAFQFVYNQTVEIFLTALLQNFEVIKYAHSGLLKKCKEKIEKITNEFEKLEI